MKKNFSLSLFLFIVALLPLSVSAQIQGSFPGSADPTWTCSLSAQAVYVDQNWNDIQYTVTYRMPSDFGVNTVLAADISWGSVTVFQEYDVTLGPTGLGTRAVSKDGVTKFQYRYNTQDAPRQVQVVATLGEKFCGGTAVDVVSQDGGAMNLNFNFGNNINSANTQPVELNIPQQPVDRDDAVAEPVSGNGSGQEMIIRDNLSPEFQPPAVEVSPEAAVPEVATDSDTAQPGVVSTNTINPVVPSQPAVVPDRSGSRMVADVDGESQSGVQVLSPENETDTLLYALVAGVGVLLAIVIYLLIRNK